MEGRHQHQKNPGHDIVFEGNHEPRFRVGDSHGSTWKDHLCEPCYGKDVRLHRLGAGGQRFGATGHRALPGKNRETDFKPRLEWEDVEWRTAEQTKGWKTLLRIRLGLQDVGQGGELHRLSLVPEGHNPDQTVSGGDDKDRKGEGRDPADPARERDRHKPEFE